VTALRAAQNDLAGRSLPTSGVNERTLDIAVNSLTEGMGVENKQYNDHLIETTAENISSKYFFLMEYPYRQKI